MAEITGNSECRAAPLRNDVSQAYGRENLQALLSTLDDLVFVLDRTGQILCANDSVARRLGWSPAELVGLNWSSLCDAEGRVAGAAVFARAPEAGGALLRTTLVAHDATPMPVTLRVRPVRWDGQEATVAVARDASASLATAQELAAQRASLLRALSEREATLNALRESEARYRYMVEDSADVFWHLDNDFRFTYLSGARERLSGFSRDEMIGRSVFSLLKPEGVALIKKSNAIRREDEGRGITTGMTRYELEVLRGDGSYMWAELTVNPFRNEAGEFVGYHGVMRDIRDRKLAEQEREQAQAALADREATLRNLVVHASDGIVLTDRQGLVVEWNSALEAISGLARDETLGWPLSRALPWLSSAPGQVEDDAGWMPIPGERIPGRLYDDAVQRPDGAGRIIESVFFPIPLEFGTMWGGVLRDVTELRRAEDSLVQQQKLETVSTLAGGVAHDFNNIFQAALGQASMALARLEPEHSARAHVAKLMLPIERGTQLTRQLLAYAGKGRYSTDDLDVNLVVRECETLMRSALPERVDLTLILTPELPLVPADAAQLKQTLTNLIINAGEAFEGRSGQVWVSTGSTTLCAEDQWSFEPGYVPSPGCYVTLQVTDNGSGMDPAVRQRAFEPFFSTRFTGRGLGLSAVLGIVRSHGGGVQLTSSPGVGTTVIVYWPAKCGAEALATESAAPSGEAHIISTGFQPTSRSVLVVDDEEAVRAALVDILESAGYGVLTAADGREALAQLAQHGDEVALVVLDLLMPVLGGAATLREMRALDYRVPVLLSTGYDEHEVKQRLAAGQVAGAADGFLQKPYDIATLLSEVDRLARPPVLA